MKQMRCIGDLAVWTVIVLATSIVLLVVAYLSTAHAEEPKFNGYTCEDARRVVAEVGKVRAMALAIESGLSLRQIWQIRRSCKL
ncbi:hypothetical protein ACVMIH_000062 [Bradyrhizobium sp. USDA 4503]